jgi:hypothetical protein
MCQNLDLWLLPFIVFCQVFSLPLFRFFDLAFYCLFHFFDLAFYYFLSGFPLLFRSYFVPFLSHVVPSLVYANLLGNKMLGCYCCCCRHEPTPKIVFTVSVP